MRAAQGVSVLANSADAAREAVHKAARDLARKPFAAQVFVGADHDGAVTAQPQRLIQRLASAVVLAAPGPLIAAFFLDPARGVHGSPWTVWTMRALFAAAALLAFANLRSDK